LSDAHEVFDPHEATSSFGTHRCLAVPPAVLCCLKAFDVLERLDPNPEFYEAKRGAAVGAFQAIIAGKEQVRHIAYCEHHMSRQSGSAVC
jgi:hypothetical protein